MPTMKGLLFNQFAAEGLSSLVEEMQSKYTTKKGRRFNHNNVTYEVSRPSLNDGAIEYEISSKIPEDEIKGTKEMQAYFQQIKKILSKGKSKPESIEMPTPFNKIPSKSYIGGFLGVSVGVFVLIGSMGI